MKIVLFILFIILISGSYSCNNSKNKEVLGSVKKCEVFDYKYKFGEIDLKSKYEKENIYYDKNNNIIKKLLLDTDGSINNDSTWHFDANGKLIEVICSSKFFNNKITYKYNKNG
ncbi:MAG: hypothetical protein WCT77_09405, partial [Bacteroidota bacterium]